MKLPETKNRNFKIVAVWLGMGGLGFAYVFINLAQDYPPSATQVSDGYWVFLGGALVIGAMEGSIKAISASFTLEGAGRCVRGSGRRASSGTSVQPPEIALEGPVSAAVLGVIRVVLPVPEEARD